MYNFKYKLFSNYYIKRQLLASSASKCHEVVESLRMKSSGKSYIATLCLHCEGTICIYFTTYLLQSCIRALHMSLSSDTP